MVTQNRISTVNKILSLIKEGQWKEVRNRLSSLLPADKSDVYESLEVEQQQELLPVARAGDLADILEQLGDQAAAELAETLDPEVLVTVLNEMAPDEVANLLGDIDPGLQQEILAQLPDAENVGPLLRYPDDSAGGLMTSEFYVFPEEISAYDILREIKEEPSRDEEVPYIYGVDQQGRLTGVIRLADLLRAHPEQSLRTIAKTQIVFIGAQEDQELAARLLNRYDLMALPVVDRQKRILGVITADDAMAVLEAETTEDIYKKVGILSGQAKQEPNSDLLVRGPVWRVWAVRVPFLLIAMVGSMLAGAVIEIYSEVLAATVVLAFFIPIIMDMGGNAGVQSTAIFIRGYVLGHVDINQFFSHMLREIAIGLGMGVVLGLITGLFAALWLSGPAVGLVVGLSLTLTITFATMLGFLIPFILTKLGVDPAAGSGPLITTLQDITGLFIYFTLATLLLEKFL